MDAESTSPPLYFISQFAPNKVPLTVDLEGPRGVFTSGNPVCKEACGTWSRCWWCPLENLRHPGSFLPRMASYLTWGQWLRAFLPEATSSARELSSAHGRSGLKVPRITTAQPSTRDRSLGHHPHSQPAQPQVNNSESGLHCSPKIHSGIKPSCSPC